MELFMIKIKSCLSAMLAMLLFCFFQICNAESTNSYAVTDAASQQSIFNDINAYRIKHGLSKLKMNNTISIVAESHSRDMADNNVSFGHDGFNARLQNLLPHFKKVHGMAENVAYTYKDAREVVEQWLDSSGHRKNIEGNYNLTGIGIAHDRKGRMYVTQIFLNVD